jgi:phosphate transport system protein
MGEHTVSSFDEDLDHIDRLIRDMGDLAGSMVSSSTMALLASDNVAAQRVISDDTIMDAKQRELDDRAITLIAKRQPMAQDLRSVVGAIRMAADLERIGDLAKNIDKRVAELNSEFRPQKLIRGVEHMAALVLSQLKQVLDSYAGRNLPSALDVWKRDKEVDAMCTSLFRELLTYMMEDPRNITFCIHLMFSAKNIERMGDHATNIAETVHYMIEGRPIMDERPKGDTTRLAAGAGG